jgi:tetratricopeptide (TPR) repeat protein
MHDATEANMHTRLGCMLLKRGHVEEALQHAVHARAVRPPSTTVPSTYDYTSDLYALGADALEKLGRYEEAREWDAQVLKLNGVLKHSCDRRRLEHLLATGDTEVGRPDILGSGGLGHGLHAWVCQGGSGTQSTLALGTYRQCDRLCRLCRRCSL